VRDRVLTDTYRWWCYWFCRRLSSIAVCWERHSKTWSTQRQRVSTMY